MLSVPVRVQPGWGAVRAVVVSAHGTRLAPRKVLLGVGGHRIALSSSHSRLPPFEKGPYVQVRFYTRAHTAKTILAQFRRKPREVTETEEPKGGELIGWIWFGLCVLIFGLFVFCFFRQKISRKRLSSIPEEIELSDMKLNKNCEYKILRRTAEKISRQSNEFMNNLLSTVESIVESDAKLQQLGIESALWPCIKKSWANKDPHFLGRLDVVVDFNEGAKTIMLVDYNTKNPSLLRESVSLKSTQSEKLEQAIENHFTTLYTSSIIVDPKAETNGDALPLPTPTQTENERHPQLHFVVLSDDPEEKWNATYLAERAKRGGFDPVILTGSQIFWNGYNFVDSNSVPIERIWNPEPWKILKQIHVKDMERAFSSVKWIEPMWKIVLENETFLPYLWEKNYFNDNYLQSNFTETPFVANKSPYVKVTPDIKKKQITAYQEDGTIQETYSISTPSPPKIPLFLDNLEPPLVDDNTRYMAYTWLIGNVTKFIGFQEDKTNIFSPNRVAVQTTLSADCVPSGFPIFRPFSSRRWSRGGGTGTTRPTTRANRARASTASSRPIFGTKASGVSSSS